jgi:hypothetical protein
MGTTLSKSTVWVTALAATLALLFAALNPAGADARGKTRAFHPVDRTAQALIFAPRDVDARSVRAAKVHLRRHGKSRTRRVSVFKVRRAAKSGSRVRVQSKAARGKLEVKIEVPSPTEPPVEEPPVEEPPVEEPPVEEPPVEEPPVEEPPVEDPTDPSCAWGEFSASNQPGPCWRPYSDASPFNVGVGSAPQAVSNSRSIVTRTLGFGEAGPRGGTMFTGGIADTSSDYDHPIYYSQPSDPVYTVRCRKWVSSCTVDGLEVRIPAKAQPAGGSDGHLAVIDQDSGWEYGFWETEARSATGGTLWIGHGGRTRIGTADSTGLGSSTNPNAVTAAHFGLAAGVIRPEELAAGQINHALFMSVKCTNGTYVWPARGPGVGRTCESMGLSNENAPALGQHFYLDMTPAQINGLSVPAWKKTILRAMAEYGMFVGDTGSTYLGWAVSIQSGSSYTSFGQPDPWVGLAKKYGIPQSSGGKYYFDLAGTIDWAAEMRVAEPCVSRSAC